MRFALDAHALGRHLTGNEVYARNLLQNFVGLDPESEFVAYLSSDDAAAWVPASCRTYHVSANPFVRLGLDFPWKLRQDPPDLLHVQYTAPLACPVPVVVSVHDVSFLEHPEYFTAARATQLRWTVRRTVRVAARVVTGSDFSRRSILRCYPELDERHVTVIPNAASSEFRPVSRESATDGIREELRFTAPFILSVGDLQPRKNHVGLIAAFECLVRNNPRLPHHLVLAGKSTWYAEHVYEAARNSTVADRIHFPGFVSDRQLLWLYNACDLFVFPSFYEGFGLPVLEAMACGRAVACSRASALTEVADGAAILFDPESADEIARAMLDVLLDPELRLRMERLGLQRSTHFHWRETARRTLDLYYEVAAPGQVRRPCSTPVTQR